MRKALAIEVKCDAGRRGAESHVPRESAEDMTEDEDELCSEGDKLRFVSPKRITYDELPVFLKFCESTKDLVDCRIECDCRWLTFVDPMGLCLLRHWLIDLAERGVYVHLHNLRYSTESFMQRMDLFKGIGNVTFEDHTSANARRDLTGQLIELKSLYDTEKINPCAQEIAKAIVHGIEDFDFTPDPEQMLPSEGERAEELLEYVFSEILLNSLDHGRKRNYKHAHANIAALYYPKLQKLEVAILDNGCGLLETLQSHPKMEGDITDQKAIEIALIPRVSCNRDAEYGLDSRNQGIGLTVSMQIALAAAGRCGVFSGASRRSILSGNTQVDEIPYWRGTGVFFQFNKTTALLGVSKKAIIEALPKFKQVNKIRFE